MRRDRAILIAGPTAGGKSALALDLARRLDGVVINADAMQVYADLAILTSRPSPLDLAAVPHRLFGHVDGAQTYSVARWLAEVADAIATARGEDRVPILVGGTGLYYKALVEGLSDIPAVPDEIRAEVRASAEGQPPEELYRRLAACDPLTASRLRPTDPQRILRALEVFRATGEPLAGFQGARQAPVLAPADYAGLFLAPEREALNAAIGKRLDQMVDQGAFDEVRALEARHLDPALPVMRALGVPQFLAMFRGELAADEAVGAAKMQTRRYAKRQMTFGRHQLGTFAMRAPHPDLAGQVIKAWTCEERLRQP